MKFFPEDVLNGGGDYRRIDSDGESTIRLSSKRQRKHCPIQSKGLLIG